MGSLGAVKRQGNKDYNVTQTQFLEEAKRQGINGNELQAELEDYVVSSYGALSLGDRITDFIEKAPGSMMYNGGTLYRGLMFNSERELNSFLNSHKVGNTLKTRKDGLSWTASKSVAQEFSTEASDHAVILVNDDSNRIAMGIKNIADTNVRSSEEVLYSNKVDFTVSKVERKDGVVYLHVSQKRGKK